MQDVRKRMEVIPAIDLLGGCVVRLCQGDFDRVTEYVSDPIELARRYVDAGARRLHVVDLDGAKSGQPTNLPIIERLASLDIELQTGGGIRDLPTLQRLLDAGVRRGVIGSAAVKQPDTVNNWMRAVGPACVILAMDVRLDANGAPEVLTDGWTEGSGDTHDQDSETHPGAVEFCDGADNDGNGELDDGCDRLCDEWMTRCHSAVSLDASRPRAR